MDVCHLNRLYGRRRLEIPKDNPIHFQWIVGNNGSNTREWWASKTQPTLQNHKTLSIRIGEPIHGIDGTKSPPDEPAYPHRPHEPIHEGGIPVDDAYSSLS